MNLTEREVQGILRKVKPEVAYQGETFTIAKAMVIIPERNKAIIAEGVARRSHTQKFDINIGINRACSMAMKSLAKKLRRKRPIVHHPFMG